MAVRKCRVHLSLSIPGALQWSNADFKRIVLPMLHHDDGTPYRTMYEAKEALINELLAGRKYLPIGDECDNFDPLRGCLGHVIEETDDG